MLKRFNIIFGFILLLYSAYAVFNAVEDRILLPLVILLVTLVPKWKEIENTKKRRHIKSEGNLKLPYRMHHFPRDGDDTKRLYLHRRIFIWTGP